MDMIYNGQAMGSVAKRLLAHGGDVNAFRPWQGADGRDYVLQNRMVDGKRKAVSVPVQNANATLQRLEWTTLDRAVMRVALPRLKAVNDLRSRGLELVIPEGMGKTVLDTQRMSDINAATISMDPVAKSPGDRPVFDLSHLPLPVIHKDFGFTARQLATSRRESVPIDTAMAEMAARRVAEGAEQLLLGVGPSYTYAGGSVYGYTNFPGRITYALTLPTGANAATTILQVLAMKQLAMNQFHYGPFVLYVSPLWAQFMDGDYILTGGNVATQTLRQRLKAIDGITDVVTLDYLNGYDMVLLELDSNVAREVVAMDITTIQWETEGGMYLNFKVMCILVPQVRGDFNGNTGIVHGSVAGHAEVPSGEQFLPSGNP